jgi:5-(carboxyamino)imidazole ribonucleotide synthase
MLAMAGARIGLKSKIYSDVADAPAADVAAGLTVGAYTDRDALARFAAEVDVVTYEFENVPVTAADAVAPIVPVFPPRAALAATQDRLIEKQTLAGLGIPVAPHRAVDSADDLRMAIEVLGTPLILKTRRFGYDGKGQAVLRTPAEAEEAWALLGGRPLIYEGFVPFDRELSIIAVRGRDGTVLCYPLVENEHREGMLHRSVAPAPNLTAELTRQASSYAERVLATLDYVGVLAIEWFQVGDRLLANEMAPRVHNSGHWTTDAAVTSQFENHVRAVLGLPLGACAVPRPCVMHNLIGVDADFARRLADPHAKLHWYGKEPKARRKVGHVTVVG